VSLTTLPAMVVDDVELRARPGSYADPMSCGHVWEPHFLLGYARCQDCGSRARWVNDPRMEGVS